MDWYEKDDWYHPGPKTKKRIQEVKRESAKICENHQKEAEEFGFNSYCGLHKAAEGKNYEFQLLTITEIFKKTKGVFHCLLFGSFLKHIKLDYLVSDIDLILIVEYNYDLKKIIKGIDEIHNIFKLNRGKEYFGVKTYPDYESLDVFLLYSDLKYIGRPQKNGTINDKDEIDFFRKNNEYLVLF